MSRALALGRPLPPTTSLATALHAAAATRSGVVHVLDDGTVVEQSYRALRDDATRIASGLCALGVTRGTPVVLQLAATPDLLAALWACVLGGFVAVPTLLTARAALGDCVVLTSDERLPALESTMARVLDVTTLRSTPARSLEPGLPDDPALIVFTSSTTGAPKPVLHRGAAIAASCVAQAEANELTANDTALTWFPLHHVASLVRMHVLPVYLGCRHVIASPTWVLAEPTRWLDALEQFRATFSWAPNFAYGLLGAHLARSADRRWDLASVRRIVAAAEPIVAATIERFEAQLASHGLAPGVVRAAWGMTELCGGVTLSGPIVAQRGDGAVCVGPPIAGTNLRIVDDRGDVVAEGEVGRLHVQGATLAMGYVGAPDAFTTDGWLDTGDVGFLRDGALTITGRAKDIIIVNGRNVSPDELERALADGVRDGAIAASGFRAPGADSESVALFVHVPHADAAAYGRLAAELRARSMRALGILPAKVVAVALEELRAGAAGKVRRAELRRRLEAGELVAIGDAASPPVVAPIADPASVAARLFGLVQELGLAPAAHTDDLFDLGANSLVLAQLLARIQRTFDVQLSIGAFFDHSTLDALAREIVTAERTRARTDLVLRPGTGRRRGPVLPALRGMLELERVDPVNTLNRMSYSMWLDGPLDAGALERALHAMRARHAILRTRFFTQDGAHGQEVLDAVAAPVLEYADLSGLTADARGAADTELQREFTRRPFALAAGEVIRALLVAVAPARHRLTIVFHHVVADPQTLRIFDEELFALWRAFSTGTTAALPPPTAEVLDLVDYLERLAASDVGARNRAFWTAQLAHTTPLELRTDMPRSTSSAAAGELPMFRSASVRGQLGPDHVADLERIVRATRASMYSVLLAIMAEHLTATTGGDDVAVVSHLLYRHLAGLERSLGFFSNPLVMRVSTAGSPTFGELVARTHATVTNAFDHADCDVLAVAQRVFRLFFNYHFTADLVQAATPEAPAGVTRSAARSVGDAVELQAYELILFIFAFPDRVDVRLQYSHELFLPETAQGFLDQYLTAVKSHCATRDYQ